MKTFAIILILWAIASSAIAKKAIYEFGVLKPAELEMKSCDYEPDAAAIVLFDCGESRFIQSERGFILRFERHTRVKILKEAGFKYAEVEIPLYKGENESEIISEISGFTYNMEDDQLQKTPLNLTQVFKEDINKYYYAKKFAMPQIRVGSIIEYKYVVESPFYETFRDWEFQHDIPILHSEYKVGMIPFYTYQYRIQGLTKLTKFDKYEAQGLDNSFAGIRYRDLIYEFVLDNVPSFKDEDFISTRTDYIKKIDFQMAEINYPSGYSKKYMETWPHLSKELLNHEDFGKYIKKCEKKGGKELMHLTSKPESQRVDEILNLVKHTYKWNGYSGLFSRITMKELENEKTGSISNLNLMAIGLLRSVNIKSHAVIISTRDHGKITGDFPFIDLFNYVLIMAEVDGKMRLFDATDPFCPNNLIPSRCINGKGLVINEQEEQWVNIQNFSNSFSETSLQYSISEDDYKLVGNCKQKISGYKAVESRKNYYSDADDFKKHFTNKGIQVEGEIKVDHLLEEEKPFLVSFDFIKDVEVIDDKIIFSPMIGLAPIQNPFKQEERSLPVDMIYPQSEVYLALFNLPEGYTVESLPENVEIKNENVEFKLIFQPNENKKIQLISTYTFRKSSYEASNYKDLKQFMNLVTRKMNEKIVLVKSSSMAIIQ